MKKVNKFCVLILVTSLSLFHSSCSKDDDNAGFSGPTTGNFLKSNFDGTTFLAEGNAAIGFFTSNSLNLSGVNTSGKNVGISLQSIDDLEVGTYNLGKTQPANYGGALFLTDINTSTFAMTTFSSAECDGAIGTLEITTISSSKIEGTFSFTGKEILQDNSCGTASKIVSNGSFRIEKE